jgi:acetamidase/formamidase
LWVFWREHRFFPHCPRITLYLPVFYEGALLFLGDGHAAQSHGEIAGTGIEVTMEVELGIDLLPSKNISMPRGENPAQRFTLGIDRPLENALQAAVSEMLIWLQEDGLNMDDACQLLGQAARFELGQRHQPGIFHCLPAGQEDPKGVQHPLGSGFF